MLTHMTDGTGRIVMAASEVNEESLESSQLHHGYFTYFLLQALKNGKGADALEPGLRLGGAAGFDERLRTGHASASCDESQFRGRGLRAPNSPRRNRQRPALTRLPARRTKGSSCFACVEYCASGVLALALLSGVACAQPGALATQIAQHEQKLAQARSSKNIRQQVSELNILGALY